MSEENERFFQDLYIRYRKPLLRFADRWVGAPLNEDVVEETFLVAWSKIEALKVHPAPKHSLYRILLHKCMHEVARKSFRSELPTDMELLSLPIDMPASGLLEVLPAGLSAPDRELLCLRFEERRDFSEIAERLGIREDAARKRVSRAVAKMRELLLRAPGAKK